MRATRHLSAALALAALGLLGPAASWAQTGGGYVVDAKANVFGVSEAALSDGLSPTVVELPEGAGRVVTFRDVKGNWSCCGGQHPNGPEGGGTFAPTGVASSHPGLSDVVHATRTMFLAGVFVADQVAQDFRPGTLSFPRPGDPSEIAPELNQVFYIGKGLSEAGEVVGFAVPQGATRLLLGVADAGGFSGPAAAYADNTGSLSLGVSVEFEAEDLGEDLLLPPGSTWEYTFSDPTSDPDWNKVLGQPGWSMGAAPFGSQPAGSRTDPQFHYNTYWPADSEADDDLWVKVALDLSDPGEGEAYDLARIVWALGVDNGFKLYVNGRAVSSGDSDGYTKRWEYQDRFEASALVPGTNVVALALKDYGGLTAFDMQVSGRRVARAALALTPGCQGLAVASGDCAEVREASAPSLVSVRALSEAGGELRGLSEGEPFVLEAVYDAEHPDPWVVVALSAGRRVVTLDAALGGEAAGGEIAETRAPTEKVLLLRSQDNKVFRSKRLVVTAGAGPRDGGRAE